MDPIVAVPLGAVAVGTLGTIVSSPWWLPPWVNAVADSKRYLARPREGYAYEIGNGPVYSFIMNKKGYAFRGERSEGNREYWAEGGYSTPLESDKWWIEPLKEDEGIWGLPLILSSIPIIGRSMGGIHWIGFPPSAPIGLHQRWVSRVVADDSTSEKSLFKLHDEPAQQEINVQHDNYVLFLKGAEGDKLIPYDVTTVVTAAITNPYLAFVQNNKWLEIVEQKLLADARVLIAGKTFEQIIGKGFTDELSKLMMTRLESGREAIENELGIHIHRVEILQVDPPPEMVAIYEAQQKTILEAKAKAEAALSLKDQYEAEGNANIMRAGKNVEVARKEAEAETEYARAVGALLEGGSVITIEKDGKTETSKTTGEGARQALILQLLGKGIPGANFVSPGINAIVSMIDPKRPEAPKPEEKKGNTP